MTGPDPRPCPPRPAGKLTLSEAARSAGPSAVDRRSSYPHVHAADITPAIGAELARRPLPAEPGQVQLEVEDTVGGRRRRWSVTTGAGGRIVVPSAEDLSELEARYAWGDR